MMINSNRKRRLAARKFFGALAFLERKAARKNNILYTFTNECIWHGFYKGTPATVP